MKKSYITVILIIILILLAIIFILLRVKKNDSGQVLSEQEAINCALEKFNNFMDSGAEINSQCLGVCNGKYAVDIVHVPRSTEDNLVENQCEDFRNGIVSHFIELNKDGEVVRIV